MLKFCYDLFNKIFMRERVLVQEHQRGLLFEQGRFVRILPPGVYHFWNMFGDCAYEVCDLTTLEFTNKAADTLLKEHPDVIAQAFFLADVTDRQMALIFVDGKFYAVLPRGTQQLYWKALHTITAEMVDIAATCEIAPEHIPLLTRLTTPQHVLLQVVPEASVGLLFLDGKFEKTLAPGRYGFWRPGREIRCELVDTRLQQVDVAGQELLTKDRISLRVTLTCWFAISDPVQAKTSVTNYADHLYKELQFGLRDAVSLKTLDELLDNKDALNPAILNEVRPKLAAIGLDVRSIGIKDLILPGDMRDLLNKVLEAKKLAEANQIKRREETAATRSLLNTAKLMEDNPTLLRLKELETLEKITEQIQSLHVYSGFDRLLNELVTLKPSTQLQKKTKRPAEKAE